MDPRFETITSDDESSFKCMHFGCKSFADNHTWHYHPEFELTWIFKSSGTRFIGDSVKPYSAGDLVLVGPNLPHCWHNDVIDGDSSQDPELIVVQFSPDQFGNGILALPETARVRAMLRRAMSGLHMGEATVRNVGPMLEALVEARGMQRLILLLQVMDVMSRADDAKTLASVDYQINNDVNETNRRRIELLHKYIRDNLDREISQAEVAKMVRMTAPAFSRFFRQATGQTFVSFVNLVRINEACRLLQGGGTTITQVAYACGYNNISNFNRQFMQAKGMNPTEFLAHHRKLQASAASTLDRAEP